MRGIVCSGTLIDRFAILMRRHHASLRLMGLAPGLAAVTCSFPTDRSNEVYVTIEYPGVRMAMRGGMLVGSKFSGGGTVSPVGALELGLNMEVDAVRGRLRFTGDYDFQRIARKTTSGGSEVAVPIQQTLGRVGLAVAF
jgi:hypothetical protein